MIEAALDLCETPTLEGVTTSLQQGVVPRGVVSAGNYTYDRSAKSVVQCVASCCLSSTCEVHSDIVYCSQYHYFYYYAMLYSFGSAPNVEFTSGICCIYYLQGKYFWTINHS